MIMQAILKKVAWDDLYRSRWVVWTTLKVNLVFDRNYFARCHQSVVLLWVLEGFCFAGTLV